MKVFADYHHGGLYHALHILFVERFGWELFRPIGLEWAEKGIWRYSDNPPTHRQYLDPVNCELRPDGYYYWRDKSEEIDHKCLTFEQFQKTDIDIILTTVYQHRSTFYVLQKDHKPKAKFVVLEGNSGTPVDWSIIPNFIDTTGLYPAPAEVKRVVWPQEFPDHLFYPQPPSKIKRIRQYLNCFNETLYYPIWHQYKVLMPDFDWKMHGLNGDDGFITPVSALAESMRSTQFIWHIKQHGEGFGHIIHNAFAVGRPVITVKSFYEGKLAYPLLEDGVTCLDLDGRSVEENVARIREFSEPERLKEMSENCRKKYLEMVNFDREAERVKEFMKDLN
ncbi:MAG TPA: hypothetical protein VMY36_00050 [Patescibacteria group bacterium]|nr:hypothetical protein [Patescibacteria group bacterium]